MLKTSFRTLIALCATLLLGVITPVNAQEASPAVMASLTEYLDNLEQQNGFSGTVAISLGGETLLSTTHGFADKTAEIPITPDTVFRIGSVTKQFTSMAIMILVERGELDLEGTLGDYLDGIPEHWQGLTLHQLLTHTSGLMHSWELPGFSQAMHIPISLTDLIEQYYDYPLVGPPGAQFKYSGVGYFILAMIVEESSGLSYAGFLKQEIFEPLGMLSSGSDGPEITIEPRALGYVRTETGTADAPPMYLPVLTGGGNLFSSADDMLLWDAALTNGELLSKEGYERIYTTEKQNFAYGWMVREVNGRRQISHSGGIPGFNAFILRYPDQELCVVVLSNIQPTRVGRFANELANLILAE